MSMEIDIQIDGPGLRAEGPAVALHMLRTAIDDVADHVEEAAIAEAPEGLTGRLKAHPVERSDTRSGFSTSNNPLIGGGQAIRGAGGRFVSGKTLATGPGRAVAHVEFTLPNKPKHAVWVHNGTGLFGQYKTPIVPVRSPYLVFHIGDRKFVKRSVRGQHPQPYLTQAFELVDRTYIPYRFERLSAELHAMFGG
jgi:hypothetical protein